MSEICDICGDVAIVERRYGNFCQICYQLFFAHTENSSDEKIRGNQNSKGEGEGGRDD